MSATKVMSVGSSSGAPSPPYTTPRTDASGSVDEPTSTDLDAVGHILIPIEEVLNESADCAMLPSPPINTPMTFSPAPSVYKGGRSRGLSGIGDRLAQLKLEERTTPRKNSDVDSSNRSVVGSVQEDDDDVGSQDSGEKEGKYASVQNLRARDTATSLLSPSSGKEVPIVLGSPKLNPRMEEFLNFTSDELPVVDPDKKGTSSTVVASAGEVAGGEGTVLSSSLSIKSAKSDGVVEKSNWAEEVMDYADRAIRQMEQLAMDEFTVDPSRSFERHFTDRLNQILQGENMITKFEVTIRQIEASQKAE